MVASHQAVLCHLEFFPSFSVTKSYLLLFLIGGLKSGIFCLADDSIPEGILFFERSFPRGNQDPAAASISDGDCDAREEKQRELARKGSLKNGSMGSPVNQQPKKNNVMARTRLVVPNKGYSSLDQSPDEKPLVALDTDSDDDFDMSRYSSSGYSSAEQINQDLNIQLLKDGYRLDEIPDDEDLDLIPPKSVNPTCMCCQATSSTACHIQ
ncbi:protein FAM219A isoform X3 [Acinonyx jubatus]|uniref:Protein FAM219A isoform X3 n=1 Tax=Acinonyx jubatus TaxID=32536 RepID=A0ABM3NNF8_ACIJB|nr:protein FAM219A isoform X3 [Acinonyx jubatus]